MDNKCCVSNKEDVIYILYGIFLNGVVQAFAYFQ